MLITPQDVRNYTTSSKVKTRTDEQLNSDILRAESELVKTTGRKIEDPIFSPLSEKVKLFLILWSEYYGASSDFESSGIISETFDDYSYKKSEATGVPIPDAFYLIEDYILETGQVGKEVVMKLRRL